MELPESLIYKEEHFRRTGRIVLTTDELFREASWFAVLMGQGIHPADYNPLVDVISSDNTRAHLEQVKQAIRAAVERMPAHGAFIRDHRAAPALATA
jgi:tryptophan halogenase